MTLWIVLTTIAAIVAVGAAAPFLRRAGAPGAETEGADATAVYRDQLRQIDAELASGVISAAEAEGARAEVGRRLVVAERDEKAKGHFAPAGDRTFAAIGIAGAVALGSAVLYGAIGTPERIPVAAGPGAGAGGMLAAGTGGGGMPSRHPPVSGNATAAAQPDGDGQADGGAQRSNLPTVDSLIDRLALRLKTNPEDPDGWRMLGWSYASQSRFDEAVAAYGEAIKRQPDNGDYYSARGEILVRASGGMVTPEASKDFEETLKHDKADPRARYFLGLKKEQAGDRKGALDDWIEIVKGAPAGETWAQQLRMRVETLASELKVDIAGRLPAAAATAAAEPAAPPRLGGANGPGILGTLQKEAGAAGPAAAHPPTATAAATAGAKPGAAQPPAAPAQSDDQFAMIRGMVDGLAARLEKDPKDAQGWGRLIRSRVVLGETDKAKEALATARKTFADTPDVLNVMAALAKELALE